MLINKISSFFCADHPLEILVLCTFVPEDRLDTNKSLVVVDSQGSHNPLFVFSIVGVADLTNREKHFSIISNPLKSIQKTIFLIKQRLNFADLLAFWNDVVIPFVTLAITVIRHTANSIYRYELIAMQITILTHTFQWIVPV